jgi:hypothetical protein
MNKPNLTFLNQELSTWLIIAWLVVAILTLFLFLRTIPNRTKTVDMIVGMWITLQSVLAIGGFYKNAIETPQVLFIGVGLPILFVISMLFTGFGKRFIDSLDLKKLTFFHIVRIPVEFLILWLFIENQVPELMTFEGQNFDIISGITAPIIAFWAFREGKVNKKLLLAWNLICLGLLFNIVITAILSAPLPFQKLAFEQPNVGVLKFAANLLPSFIVPLVFFGHLAAIRRLLR